MFVVVFVLKWSVQPRVSDFEFCYVCDAFVVLFTLYMCDLQLHDEYELDKQQAMDRIASEVEQSIVNMQNCIERTCEHQRDELIQRLEREQKERVAALKRHQWVCVVFCLYTGHNLQVQQMCT